MKSQKWIPFIFFVLYIVNLAPVCAGPRPGDIFREYTFNPHQDFSVRHFSELDPACKRVFEEGSGFESKPRMVKQRIDLDLDRAVRAEMAVEYWGGHIGTSDQKFKVNGREWIQIPQPRGTPTDPNCYYRVLLGNETVPIPLEQLQEGCNEVQFTCGPQTCHNFDWGFYWIYSFSIIVHYDPSKPHPEGRITAPVSGSTVIDRTKIAAMASSDDSRIKRVDFIGYYKDFDWEGNGIFSQYHYQTQYGEMTRHIGTSYCAPYSVTWDSEGLPDQDEPMKIVAKLTDWNGISYMTPAVENLLLERQDRSVKMYISRDVPEKFGVRESETRKSCTIQVDDSLENATSARLVLSTWCGAHAVEIGLNGKKLVDVVGNVHDYSYDILSVGLDMIKPGINEFYVHAVTPEHAVEVNWPGPVLMIEFIK